MLQCYIIIDMLNLICLLHMSIFFSNWMNDHIALPADAKRNLTKCLMQRIPRFCERITESHQVVVHWNLPQIFKSNPLSGFNEWRRRSKWPVQMDKVSEKTIWACAAAAAASLRLVNMQQTGGRFQGLDCASSQQRKFKCINRTRCTEAQARGFSKNWWCGRKL